MTGPSAEMPFLEHLEELRARVVRVVLALLGGSAVGFWAVQHFQLVSLLAEPIAPYLAITGGKLTVTSPTEPVMIVFKLALISGLILTSPYIVYQIWGFLAPALYEREKRTAMPALGAGVLLFLVGAVVGYAVLLPLSLPVLFSFQTEGLAILITYEKYFGFVLQIMLGMGLAFEIPLVMVMLTALGVSTPAGFTRFRRFAVVLAAVGGAILSPGTDVLSMIMVMVPLLLLYEIGYLGSWLVHRRRRSAAAAAPLLALLLLGTPASLAAQADTTKPRPPKPVPARPAATPTGRDSTALRDTLPADSLRRPEQAVDTATARRLGLPTAPRHPFAGEDSVITALLAREGYQATRFRSDSAIVFADERRLILRGDAGTKRGETHLEADSILYEEANCLLRATGHPALFDGGTVLTGFGGIRYNTCIRRGVVSGALTTFKQGATDWFLRGNLAQDSSAARLYASDGNITSCDLPEAHYHFSAREVKWISKTVMVARPAVLYIRDVPVLWLPFVFQDARTGRRSGILIPRFGLNDIVRQDPGYNRQITNMGYYWAPNEFLDVTAKLDWYSDRLVEYGAAVQYRWLDRFATGGIGYRKSVENTGRRSTAIRWDHRQAFNVTTSLNLTFNYTSSGFVQQRNAIDPVASTQQIVSSANFTKRFVWGSVAVGGNRRQNLSDNSVSMELPSLAISPKPIDLSGGVTWSPGLSVRNSFETDFPVNPTPLLILPSGVIDSSDATRDTRTTTVNFDTPLRLGGFNLRNSFAYQDRDVNGPTVVTAQKVPDPTTLDPTDSLTVSQTTIGDFSSDLDWQTGISLPTVLRNSWKLQPTVGVANSTSGAFLIRNRNTGGSWVRQGKRFNLGLAISPTFFGFFPGVGPLEKIRHSVSPVVNYSYSPAASVNAEYAQAVTPIGQTPRLRSDPTQLLSVGLSQNFEGKARPAPGDTAEAAAKKYRILGIQTSSIQYDFEQAKKPGFTGWRTQAMTNQFQSDLLPGFNLSLTHDLWDGVVGTDTAAFDPFLQAVTASFAISGRTVRSILGFVGLGGKRDSASREEPPPASYVASQSRYGRPPSFFGAGSEQTLGAGSSRRFIANFNYSLARDRDATAADPSQQSLGFSTSFSPTPFWSVSWSTQYNITAREFESQVVRLERVLHEWRAGFNFVRNPNGNFAFYFSVYLSDLPDIKFDYNQTSLDR